MAHQPAMRSVQRGGQAMRLLSLAGKPFLDEWLAETRQPVGPWTGRVEVNSCPY